MMRYEYTNGCHPDFILLCHELDCFLNELAGGEQNRSQYILYNTLEDIHDVVLAYHGTIPVGCAGFKQYDTSAAEVKRVFVRSNYRGQGISKRILESLEQKARAKGYSRLILETGRPLVAALELYKRFGFQVRPNYGQYKDMTDSICMEKSL